MTINTLAKILSCKQTSYNSINYHMYTKSDAKVVPISMRIPPALYDKIDSESDIKPIPICTQDSFFHAILFFFDEDYPQSDWVTKTKKVNSIKANIIDGLSENSSVRKDIYKGALYSKDTMLFLSHLFSINIVVATLTHTYIKTIGKSCITIVLIESDREIYYPVSINDICIHSYPFLNNFPSEKNEILR